MTNIARGIWPNLKSDERLEQQQQRAPNLASALYPGLVPKEPNPREAWETWFMRAIGLRKTVGGK